MGGVFFPSEKMRGHITTSGMHVVSDRAGINALSIEIKAGRSISVEKKALSWAAEKQTFYVIYTEN